MNFQDDFEDEFCVCIRPASASSPNNMYNLHLLSAASMVVHDSQTFGKRSNTSHDHIRREKRHGGSANRSNTSSGSSIAPADLLSNASGQKTGTSSETGSTGSEDTTDASN